MSRLSVAVRITDPMSFALLNPVAAAGYSFIYLLFSGGLFGASVVFIVANVFGP